MNFLEIQNAVLLDRFSEAQRNAVKDQINSRYGRVWALEPWSFKRTSVEYMLPAGDDDITLTQLGLQKVDAVYKGRANGFEKLYGDRPENFNTYAMTTGGRFYAFTVVGDTIVFERPPTTGETITVIGELKWTPLVNDGDIPLLPREYHYALVQGAASDMLIREADPTWQGEEKQWTDQIVEMRLAYMGNTRALQGAYPPWP